MRALLLAAGYGKRLRPITNHLPKCLVPIHGKPLLDYWFNLLLADTGIDYLLVNTHYLPSQVEEFIATSPRREQIELQYEEELLGTGGTLLKACNFFHEESFMVVHADNLSNFNVRDFIMSHNKRKSSCEITMMLFETDQPQNCGIVELDDDGVVVSFHEKVENPPSNLANGAVYIFEPVVLDFIRGLGEEIIDLSTEVLPFFVGRINTFLNSDYHRDIGTLESLLKAEKEFVNR
jgi:mannose-1-phosphate guanylyltransferase